MWQDLTKPIIGLSPMDGVTDAPMRQITAKYGNPDLIFTEFVHVKGLWLGKLHVFNDLIYSIIERPIIAQLFGNEPEYFYKAAHIICELGFDGIDINMGCPANSIIKKGGGAALITNPKLAQQIILKTKQGVNDWVRGQNLEKLDLEPEKINYIRLRRQKLKLTNNRIVIPVSVKTRIGYKNNTIKEWVKYLIETKPGAISIHGRTFEQLYSGTADWDAIGTVVESIHKENIIYLGNGDVISLENAKNKCRDFKVDGVLIGRAAFGNPWIFKDKNPTTKDRLLVAIEHAYIHSELKNQKRFFEMRKHLGWYCKGFNGAKDLRIKLMQTNNVSEVQLIIKQWLSQNS